MFWNARLRAEYHFAPKLKKYYVSMILLAVVGLVVVAILTRFFYRSVRMDIAGAILTALVCTAILALLVAGAIYGGQIFG